MRRNDLWIALGGILLLVPLWVGVIILIRGDFVERNNRLERDNHNLAVAVAEQTDRALQSVDQVLRTVAYLADHEGVDFDLRQVIERDGLINDLVVQLSYADERGQLRQSTLPGPVASVSIADRQHFRVQADGLTDGLYISEPVFGRASGRWSIQLTRRVTRADGSFAGVIIASVDPDYFKTFYSGVDLGREGMVTLVGSDGQVRARSLMGANGSFDIRGSGLLDFAFGRSTGVAAMADPIDQTRRIYAAARLRSYPLAVLVGSGENSFLKAFRIRRNIDLMAGSIGTVAILLFIGIIRWQLGQQEAAEARLRQAIESMSDAFILFDPNDRLLIWNKRYEVTFPYLKNILRPGMTFHDIAAYTAAHGPVAIEPAQRATWLKWRLERHLKAADTFQQALTDNRTIETSERPTMEGGVVGVSRDITPLKETARKLAASEARFRDFAEVASDWFWESGPDLRYTFVSDRIAAYGIPPEQLIGIDHRNSADPAEFAADPEKWRAHERVLADREPFRDFRFTMRGGDGLIQVSLRGKPVFAADGAFLGYRGCASEISAQLAAEAAMREAAEAAEAANRAKSDFLANMSHEVRTPMNGVLGMTSVLLGTALDEEQRRFCVAINSSAASLLQIINDILDYSKLEAGKIDLEAVPFRTEMVIDNVVSLMSATIKEKGLEIDVTCAPAAGRLVIGDPHRVRQILLNLLSNAIKFSDAGRIAVSVDATLSSLSEPSDSTPDASAMVRPALDLRVTVTDTGPGIAPELRSRLFERFSQADASTTRRYGGSGLGLAICRQLVDRMGGKIGVDSATGAGSRFWFSVTLPLAPADLDAVTETTVMTEARTTPMVAALDILAVEDNRVNQMVIGEILRRAGHKVSFAQDGHRAVTMVSEHNFDLILMDVHMPGMDGLAATRAIRAMAGRAAVVPIIALTADAMAGDREKYLAAGMTDYVSKPIVSKRLFEAIDRSIDGVVRLGPRVHLRTPVSPGSVENGAPHGAGLGDAAAAIDAFIADLQTVRPT
ncbi:MAG TPA: ATP-binding protein [Stellaceae bacterium]|nr:ATP-binding protein [Stellaceae bacterium]